MKKYFSHEKLRHLIQFLGIEFNVFQILMLRSWGIFAGGLTIILITVGLDPQAQGYYYVFSSILALQIFFELGLNQVITIIISHDAAKIKIGEDGILAGYSDDVNRLKGLIASICRWYKFVSIFFALVVGPAGWFFLNSGEEQMPTVNWLPTWIILIVLTSCNLYLSPRLAIVEGIGFIGQVARIRLVQSFFGYIALWLLLLNGAELWATIALPLTSALFTFAWLKKKSPWINDSHPSFSVNWRRDIFPLQWRIGLSWISGYILFNLFTPIVFSTHGSVEAGRLGIAIAIFSAVTSLGMSWVTARAPQWTMRISRGEHHNLNKHFALSVIQSTCFTALLSLLIILSIDIMYNNGIEIGHRIVNINILYWMGLSSTINCLIFGCATFMRAHKEEPMMIPSIVGALVTLFIVFITKHDMHIMMMSNALVQLFFGLPLCIFLLVKYIKKHNTK